MRHGIGVDVTEPDRMRQRLANRPALRDELFTAAEQEYCEQQAHPHQHYAARWCAKEAVVKALGLDGFDPREIEVIVGDPQPRIRLTGDAAAGATDLGVELSISLSHVAGVAVAIALAVPRSD